MNFPPALTYGKCIRSRFQRVSNAFGTFSPAQELQNPRAVIFKRLRVTWLDRVDVAVQRIRQTTRQILGANQLDIATHGSNNGGRARWNVRSRQSQRRLLLNHGWIGTVCHIAVPVPVIGIVHDTARWSPAEIVVVVP